MRGAWIALIVVTSCVPPTSVETELPSPAAVTPRAPSASLAPLPSFPANVTYAGWVVVTTIRRDGFTVTATMGSPGIFERRSLTLVGPATSLRVGDCILVEFVAQPDADGTHRLLDLDQTKRSTDPRSCQTSD